MTFKTDKNSEVAIPGPPPAYWLEVSVQDEGATAPGVKNAARASPARSSAHGSLMRSIIALAGLVLAGCATQPPVHETRCRADHGQRLTVKIAGHLPRLRRRTARRVQAQFDAVNLALSTYRADRR
jgi:hypothetical protein